MSLILTELNCIILEEYMRKNVKNLMTRAVLCDLICVKEYKGLMFQLFFCKMNYIKKQLIIELN